MSKITVVWEVNDGYIGPARPQKFELDVDDLVWELGADIETPSTHEILDLIQEHVCNDALEKITYAIRDTDDIVEAVIARAEELRVELGEEIES